MSVGIGLIEFIEPSDTLNYKSYFKNCILQTILNVFFLFTFVWNKIFCSKNGAVYYICNRNSPLRNVREYVFPTLCNILHLKTQSIPFSIKIIDVMCMTVCKEIIQKGERKRKCKITRNN